jgi:hypothetical protein
MEPTRRTFLEQVGQGVILASVGPALSAELGLISARADEAPARLNFGKREALVQLLQETPPDRMLPLVVARLRQGTELKELVACAALANARNFGGENYIGYHTMMALAPSYLMASELPKDQQALPVLKVLYRNSSNIANVAAKGGKEVLTPVEPAMVDKSRVGGEVLRDKVRTRNMMDAEQTFATLAAGKPDDAFNDLLYAVEDDAEVHRVVLAYRAWDMLDLVGKEHAHTMLRQSVHYCVQAEKWAAQPRPFGNTRTILPKMLDRHKLLGKSAGKRRLDDAGLLRLSQDIFKATPEQAAGLAAEALADGIAPDDIGEAITLATCELLLRDEGRPQRQTSPGKPVGSVHGDSIGVHACDSSNAWRNLARVSNWRNTAACLILGAYQAARDRIERGGDFLRWEAYPRKAHQEKVTARETEALLREAEAAIKDRDQVRAAATVHRYLKLGHPDKAVFALLLKYAISEDGALHAEKFYRTATEEYRRTRAAFRIGFAVGLARVTASACGQPAPGHSEACKLLKA